MDDARRRGARPGDRRDLERAAERRSVRAQARRLFATALETPGGLKVQTIHAFCTRLLQQFPFEADVAARFAVLDDAAETELLNRTSMGVLLEADACPTAPLGRALAVAISAVADQTFKDVVAEAIRKRDLVTKWIERCRQRRGGGRRVVRGARRRCGRDRRQSRRRDRRRPDPPSRWLALATRLDGGSKSDRDAADRLRAAAPSTAKSAAKLYRRVFITETNHTPRKQVGDRQDGSRAVRPAPRRTRSSCPLCSSGATPSRAATARRRCSPSRTR